MGQSAFRSGEVTVDVLGSSLMAQGAGTPALAVPSRGLWSPWERQVRENKFSRDTESDLCGPERLTRRK